MIFEDKPLSYYEDLVDMVKGCFTQWAKAGDNNQQMARRREDCNIYLKYSHICTR